MSTLASEKTQLEADVELLNQEKDRLHTDVELLEEEKDTLHKVLSEEKDEFIHSAINEVNEKVVARDYQELWEAQQELIKQMESVKVTRDTVIGVERMRGESGDQVLWNFRDKRRATLKEVMSFQVHLTDK
ncbi:hypothetical protein MKW94_002465 [Papaver nudicaule]|uniref:Uncharacterized protein n=1 Tax=Papaver nudicaule TaxID=74823 RepID=A0AA41S2B0_PAPNU|nr:hypothetical protein [Papaver nudicaule]